MSNSDEKKTISFSREELISILEEANYRSAKRIEDEKKEGSDEKKEGTKVNIFLSILMFIFLPFFYKSNSGKKNTYDAVLVLGTTIVLYILGAFLWIGGVAIPIAYIVQYGFNINAVSVIAVGLIAFIIGSTNFVAAESFSTETDSNKIASFSSGFCAFCALIIAAIALFK